MNLTMTYEDLKSRIEESESQFLSEDPKLIVSTDDLKRTQRDTLHYFDLNGLLISTFAGYHAVQQLNFSPLQPSGADAQKKLMDRLHGDLRTLSNELDRAEAIRKREGAGSATSIRRTETEIGGRVGLEPLHLTGDNAVHSWLEPPHPNMVDSQGANPRGKHRSRRRQVCAAVDRVKSELDQLLSDRYPNYESMRNANPNMSVFQIADQNLACLASIGKNQTTLKNALLRLPKHGRHLLSLAKAFVAQEFDITPDAVKRHWKGHQTLD
jgi:hypothetical protein